MRRNARVVVKYVIVLVFIITPLIYIINFISQDKPERKTQYLNAHGVHPLPPEKIPQEEHFVDVEKRPITQVIPLLKYGKYEKIDWHDYKQIEEDAKRSGRGEHGVAVQLTPEEEKIKDPLYKVNGFNAFLSDKIPLNRSLPDIRNVGCRNKTYLGNLLTVSVVVPFHNEHFSTLLRTAQSVIDRSPKHLLHEVILVDDHSSKEHCKKPLDDYVKQHYSNVFVIHLPERSGLIRARLAGANAATGDVLLFLDSHTEANVNFLPPLLEPIAEDYKTVVCPFIDVIDYETFAYKAQDEGARGAFDWQFYYKRLPLLPEDLKKPTEPFLSPVMAGGLFAMSRKYFWELGGYDEGLEIWGGEQYELSFKIWQCGGKMVDAPCSRIGHIYRKFAPFPNPGKGDFVGRNYHRVAEVWMDEYAEFLYKRQPNFRNANPGDLTKQKELRKRLNCKPFKWFMEEIAFDLPKRYPPIEPPDFASGEIRSMAEPNLCADTRFKAQNERFNIETCGQGGEQEFSLTWHKDIRPKKRSMCWDVSSVDKRSPVLLWSCHGMQGNQLWKYDVESQHLIHGGNPRCLDCDVERKEIYVSECDPNSITQKWKFSTVDVAALAKWNVIGP